MDYSIFERASRKLGYKYSPKYLETLYYDFFNCIKKKLTSVDIRSITSETYLKIKSGVLLPGLCYITIPESVVKHNGKDNQEHKEDTSDGELDPDDDEYI